MSISEKDSGALGFLTSNVLVSKLKDAYNSFAERREALGLPNPGTVEGISKEVQRDVLLNNLSFTGLRAELNKTCSVTPIFQVSHSLATGSQMLPPYTFGAMYGSSKVFLQGNVDNDLGVTGRFNYRWTPSWVTKTSVQLASPTEAMCSIENDITGNDFTASLKAINPSVLEGSLTGIFVASYLQSVTPRLSLGMETVWQRPLASHGPTALMSWAGRYKGNDWIGSLQVLSQGGLQASYWRRLMDKVEAGVDLSLQAGAMSENPLMGGSAPEGQATIGAKYDFRQSSFRAQINSAGRVACLLEKRVAPTVQLTFSGEIDHPKNNAKVGLAVTLESATDEVMEQQEQAGVDAPAVPF